VQPRDRRDELLGLQPGDAASAVWTLQAAAAHTPGGTDITGPYIRGRPGGRFICLSWGTVDDDGFTMFRRAKLMLNAVDPATLDATRRYGRLIARLTLTDANGDPLSGAVQPPLITWSGKHGRLSTAGFNITVRCDLRAGAGWCHGLASMMRS
jgi:hypothetical protein